MGREDAYFRGIQAKGTCPSVEAQVNLASRLRDVGIAFKRSNDPTVAADGDALLKLHYDLLDDLLDRPPFWFEA